MIAIVVVQTYYLQMNFVDPFAIVVELVKDEQLFIQEKEDLQWFIAYEHLLFDCWIRDESGEVKLCDDNPVECGTGIDNDGNPNVSTGDFGLLRFACVGVIEDGEWITLSESVFVSSIFIVFLFDFFVSISSRDNYWKICRYQSLTSIIFFLLPIRFFFSIRKKCSTFNCIQMIELILFLFIIRELKI